MAAVGADDVEAVAVAADLEAAPADRVEVAIEPTASDVASTPPTELQCSVSGYVLDQDGAFLPEAASGFVKLVDALGNERVERVERDGTYSANGLAPGRWWLLAGSMGWITQERKLDLGESVPNARVDFRLVPMTSVKVKLLAPDGRPYWEAAKPLKLGRLALTMAAVATLEPPGERFDQVIGSLNNRFGVGSMRWDGQGSVHLPAEYWCLVELYAPPPLYLSVVLYHDVIETRRLEPGQEELSFTLDPASIVGRLGAVEFTLVDPATAASVPGAAVMLSVKGGSGPSFQSDAGGRVHMESVPAGLHDLRIQAPDRATAVPIRGRAVGADGNGLEAEIRICAVPEPGEPPVFGNFGYSSKPDGTIEIVDLAPGRWLLQIKDKVRGRLQGNAAEQMAPHVVVDTRAGPVEDLLVQLEQVAFAVVTWQGDDFEGLRLRFLDRDGLMRQSSGIYGTAPMRVALFPGDWRVVVVDAQGTTLTERAFTLGSEPFVLSLAPDR
jgi:hypothetical protein